MTLHCKWHVFLFCIDISPSRLFSILIHRSRSIFNVKADIRDILGSIPDYLFLLPYPMVLKVEFFVFWFFGFFYVFALFSNFREAEH